MDGASGVILSWVVSPLKHGPGPSCLFARAACRPLRLPVSDEPHEFRAAAKKVFYRAAGPGLVHIRGFRPNSDQYLIYPSGDIVVGCARHGIRFEVNLYLRDTAPSKTTYLSDKQPIGAMPARGQTAFGIA